MRPRFVISAHHKAVQPLRASENAPYRGLAAELATQTGAYDILLAYDETFI